MTETGIPRDEPGATAYWERRLLEIEGAHLPSADAAGDAAVSVELATRRFMVPDSWVESVATLRGALGMGDAILSRLGDLAEHAADPAVREVVAEHRDFLLAARTGDAGVLEPPKRHPASRVAAARMGAALERAWAADDAAAGGDRQDALDEAMAAWDALRHDPAILFHPYLDAAALQSAALARRRRFELTGDPAELRDAFPLVEGAIALVDVGSREWGAYYLERGALHRYRFGAASGVEDLDRAVDDYRTALGALHGHVAAAHACANLGSALWLQFEARGTLAALDEAVGVLREGLRLAGPEKPVWAMCQNNLGIALAARSGVLGTVADLDEAMAAYQAALAGKPRPSLSRSATLGNIGELWRLRYLLLDDAIDLDRSIGALVELLGEFPGRGPSWGAWHDALGLALLYRYRACRHADDLPTARAAFETALEHVPAGAPGRARILANLADTFRDEHAATGDPAHLDHAIDLLRQALAEADVPAAVPDHWADLGMVLADRFFARRDDADRTAALDAYAHAEAGLDPEVGPRMVLTTALWAARLHASRGRWASAIPLLRRGMRAVEVMYRLQLVGSCREVPLVMAGPLYRLAAYAMARAGRLDEAVVTIEHGRARISSETAARDHARLDAVKDRAPGLYAAYRAAVARLRRLEQRSRHRGEPLPDGVLPQTAEAANREAREALDELERTVRAIREIEGPHFLAAPGFESVARGVAPGEPLVYLVVTERGSVALIVRGSAVAGLEAVWSDGFTDAELDALLRGDAGYLNAQTRNTRLLDRVLPGVRTTVGEALVGPVAAALRRDGAHAVALVPTGHLALLPLHAAEYLVDGRTVALLDEFRVRYAPSARLLALARVAAEALVDRDEVLVAVGNPLPHPQPLRYAGAEVKDIARLFSPGRRSLLLGRKASPHALLSRLPGATHVHLACHGTFNADDPLSSHLQLAGAPLSLRQILDGQELAGVRLLVLSACKTAITEFRRLPDEAIGLPAGCLLAGAAGVICTLWSVPDTSTALLMVRLYELCLGSSERAAMHPAAALREAQRWLRDATDHSLAEWLRRHDGLRKLVPGFPADSSYQPYEDPVHWAPFTYVGA